MGRLSRRSKGTGGGLHTHNEETVETISRICGILLMLHPAIFSYFSAFNRSAFGERAKKVQLSAEAFGSKCLLFSAPELCSADFMEELALQINVSKRSLGGHSLPQEFEDGEHPILYLSRKLGSKNMC